MNSSARRETRLGVSVELKPDLRSVEVRRVMARATALRRRFGNKKHLIDESVVHWLWLNTLAEYSIAQKMTNFRCLILCRRIRRQTFETFELYL